MREFFIKYFGRILAILGCSTMVTACYGVPSDVSFEVKGRVVDAQSGNPIKNIKVTVEVENGYGPPSSEYTSPDGEFSITFYEHYYPGGFMVMCTDVDGESNGLYESSKETVPIEKAHDLVIEMTPMAK